MPDLQRLIYASRGTFGPSGEGSGIQLEVARILMQSRLNNPRSGLVGALYYGDGCFFQCLEGESAAIDELCARIAKDPRHKDMQVLGRHPIEARSFSVWAMKFVPNASAVEALMARHGRSKFDPFTFDGAMVAAVLDLLRQGKDADLLQHDRNGRRASGSRDRHTHVLPATSKPYMPVLVGVGLVLMAVATFLVFR